MPPHPEIHSRNTDSGINSSAMLMLDDQLVDVLLQSGASKRCLRLIRAHDACSHCGAQHGFSMVEKEEIARLLLAEAESESYSAEERREVPVDLQAIRVRFGRFGCFGEVTDRVTGGCLVCRSVGWNGEGESTLPDC